MAGHLPRPVGRRKEPAQSALPLPSEPEPAEVPGLSYVPDFLGEREETELVAAIEAAGWSSELQRRVQHYGWRYDYSAAIMTGDARYRWTHEIPKRKYEPGRVARGRRISLTFRKVLAPPDYGCVVPIVAGTGGASANTEV